MWVILFCGSKILFNVLTNFLWPDSLMISCLSITTLYLSKNLFCGQFILLDSFFSHPFFVIRSSLFGHSRRIILFVLSHLFLNSPLTLVDYFSFFVSYSLLFICSFYFRFIFLIYLFSFALSGWSFLINLSVAPQCPVSICVNPLAGTYARTIVFIEVYT